MLDGDHVHRHEGDTSGVTTERPLFDSLLPAEMAGRAEDVGVRKANLEAVGSGLEHVIKVTAFLADVKTEKNAFNEAYAQYFPKDAPARSAIGAEFPDTATRVEIELVALIP